MGASGICHGLDNNALVNGKLNNKRCGKRHIYIQSVVTAAV